MNDIDKNNELKEPIEEKSYLSNILLFFLDILANATIIIILVLLIRTFIIAPFQVYGPSMCNVLNYYDSTCKQGPGEYLIINKFIYKNYAIKKGQDPKRGDIIVFKEPTKQEEYYIKRIIGIPGDTLILEDGFVYIKNDQFETPIKLNETEYLNELNFGNTKAFRNDLNEFHVPENAYFVMGDNRTASADSRRLFNENDLENGAFISKDLIVGKAWTVIWPLANIRILEDPDYQVFDK